MNTKTLDTLDAMKAWFHRYRWWVRLLVYTSLLYWLGPWAYVRMTTRRADLDAVPRALSTGVTSQPVDPDHPDMPLLGALAAMPAPAAIAPPTTAPAGKQWKQPDPDPDAPSWQRQLSKPTQIDPLIVLSGPWTPQTRYHLQQAITWLQDPKVDAALDALRTLACIPSSQPQTGQWPMGHLIKMRFACKTLQAHARYQLAGRGDIEAACRDIETIFKISDRAEDGGALITTLVGTRCRDSALYEVLAWSREKDFSSEQAARVRQVLSRANVDVPARWRRMVHAETEYQKKVLKMMYANTPNSDGWLVIQSSASPLWLDKIPLSLNLFTVVMNDWQTVSSKIDHYPKVIGEIGSQPVPQALRRFRDAFHGNETRSVNPADGPMSLVWADLDLLPNAYLLYLETMIRQQAAEVLIAISVYRADHGRNPAALADLVPQYMPTIPLDPFDGQPLRYRLDETEGFVVYAVGQDGHDDGAPLLDGKRQCYSDGDRSSPDMIYTGRRERAQGEWYLEAGSPSTVTPAVEPTLEVPLEE